MNYRVAARNESVDKRRGGRYRKGDTEKIKRPYM